MSKKQWMVLLMLFLMYLLLGASIFYHIESQLELQKVEQAKLERIEINALLRENYVPSGVHDFDEILAKVSDYCGKSVYNYTEGDVDRLQWDFYNSFYFSYTVVSTIGYGNLSPTNMLSRILMMFYGLVGIPMNGILLTQLGEFFGDVFVKAHQKYKSYKRSREHYNPKKLAPFETRKVGLAAQICAYLIPGFVMFIFFPAFLFSHYEGWTYDEAVYYAFVTLTTIGFGDIVAGQDNTKGSGVFFIMYKIFLIAWISFGLGYIVMIMTFIASGMRSKRIKGLEHRLAVNLKHTQSKIWNEFHKEVNFLRRVFNELQLSKVKRVYVDEYEYEVLPAKLPRSNSFPDLRTLNFFGEPEVPLQRPRRRANSEVVPVDDQIARVVSETDLQRIDKTATFATHAMVQPAELLARLVNILGYMPPSDDNDQPDTDYRSEKDKEEQGTDWWYDTRKDVPPRRSMSTAIPWRIGNDQIAPVGKPRSRAASEVRLYETRTDLNNRNAEWTWSGTPTSQKIQELINAEAEKSREANPKAVGPKMSVFRSLGLSMPKTLIPRWKRQSSTKKATDIEAGIKSPEKGEDKRDNYNSQNATITQNGMPYLDDRRESISRRHYYTHTGANATDFYEGSNLLEETSLADFLRALTVLHAGVGTVPEKYVGKPRRKMGTASLTPPKLPSLFTLFSSPPPGAADAATHGSQSTITGTDRRLSLNVSEKQQSGASTPSGRRGSFAFIKPRRRFSLRPVATPISPPTPPNPESPSLSNSRHPNGDSKFIFESSKEPLIQMETALGISSPMKLVPGSRRSSLRPIPSGVEMSATSPSPTPIGPASKPLPRWKAGMLQRQIGQMNLRRRVRAFSLSDVQIDDQIHGRKPPFDPLEMGGTGSRLKKVRPEPLNENIVKTAGDTVRKSVTLLSPKRGQIFWPAQDDEPLQMSATTPATSSEDTVTSTNVSDTNTVVQKDTSLVTKSETVAVTAPKPPKEESSPEAKAGPPVTSEASGHEGKDTRVSESVKDSKKDSKATSTKSKPSDSKPRVSIEHYELLSEVKIEKPAENPFERYRAATSTPESRNSDPAGDGKDESKRKFGVKKRA